MKIVLMILTLFALAISIIWTIKSSYAYEPIIVTITLVISLAGMFTYIANATTNKVVVTGSENKVRVDVKNKTTLHPQKNNYVKISGNHIKADIDTDN